MLLSNSQGSSNLGLFAILLLLLAVAAVVVALVALFTYWSNSSYRKLGAKNRADRNRQTPRVPVQLKRPAPPPSRGSAGKKYFDYIIREDPY